MRPLLVGVALLVGCGGDEDDAACPGLGCPGDTGTASSAGTTVASTAGSTASSTSVGESSGGPSTSSSGAEDPSVGSSSGASTTASSSESSSTGVPCEGADCPALAECFGLGVWQSCTQYCTAGDATCVAGGCGGATVVYYGDADACVAMDANAESPQGCDEGFMQGGQFSFGRCCCL